MADGLEITDSSKRHLLPRNVTGHAKIGENISSSFGNDQICASIVVKDVKLEPTNHDRLQHVDRHIFVTIVVDSNFEEQGCIDVEGNSDTFRKLGLIEILDAFYPVHFKKLGILNLIFVCITHQDMDACGKRPVSRVRANIFVKTTSFVAVLTTGCQTLSTQFFVKKFFKSFLGVHSDKFFTRMVVYDFMTEPGDGWDVIIFPAYMARQIFNTGHNMASRFIFATIRWTV